MRDVMIYHFDRIAVIFASFMYGIQVFRYDHILETYEVYQIMSGLHINNRAVGLLFMIAAIAKLIGVVWDMRVVRQTGLVILSMLWSLFTVSFYISPPPNTIWVFSIIIVGLCYKIAYAEQ